MRFSTTTAIAQGPRHHQEDRLHADSHRVLVCDGMGGHTDGDVAASTAIELLAAADITDAKSFEQAIHQAGEAVLALGEGRYDDPGTTMVGAVLVEEGLVVGWCGDSRLYLVRDGEVRYATTDHSVLGGLERCLGADIPTEPDIDVIDDARPGDRVVVVSDGVMAALHGDTGRHVARAVSAEGLLRTCQARGLRDNTTIVMAEVLRR